MSRVKAALGNVLFLARAVRAPACSCRAGLAPRPCSRSCDALASDQGTMWRIGNALGGVLFLVCADPAAASSGRACAASRPYSLNSCTICLFAGSYCLSSYLDGIAVGDKQVTFPVSVMAIAVFMISRTSAIEDLPAQGPESAIFSMELCTSLVGQFYVHVACLKFCTR